MQGAIDNISLIIGNTPIVSLSRFLPKSKGSLHAKCEFMNPGGSIKDRIGFYMIEKAEKEGKIKPGGTIIEATAGNTGMALAMIAIPRGYKVIFVVTDKVSPEKINMLRACKAEVIKVAYQNSIDNPSPFIEYARELSKKIPNSWYADQFYNSDNFEAHYKFTGPEIWNQTNGEVDVIVAGVGTGGSLAGVGKYLKERKPSLKVVMADPYGSILTHVHKYNPYKAEKYYIEGIGGDFIPGNAHFSIIDDAIQVSDYDSCMACLELFEKEGLFVGGSSGCIIEAARRYILKQEKHKLINVLAILPDGGKNYLSTIYNPRWQKAVFKSTRLGQHLKVS